MPKLNEIGVRLRVFTDPANNGGRRLTFAIPARLTGAYDLTHYQDAVRVSHVEVEIDNALALVAIADLESAWGEPMSYRDIRRALLVLWINGTRDCDPLRAATPATTIYRGQGL